MAGPGDNRKSNPYAPVDLEPLHRAVSGCVRAISGEREAEVVFSRDRPGMSGHQIRLPEFSKRPTPEELAVVREAPARPRLAVDVPPRALGGEL